MSEKPLNIQPFAQQALGELSFQVVVLKAQLAQAQQEIAALKLALEKLTPKPEEPK